MFHVEFSWCYQLVNSTSVKNLAKFYPFILKSKKVLIKMEGGVVVNYIFNALCVTHTPLKFFYVVCCFSIFTKLGMDNRALNFFEGKN